MVLKSGCGGGRSIGIARKSNRLGNKKEKMLRKMKRWVENKRKKLREGPFNTNTAHIQISVEDEAEVHFVHL